MGWKGDKAEEGGGIDLGLGGEGEMGCGEGVDKVQSCYCILFNLLSESLSHCQFLRTPPFAQAEVPYAPCKMCR